MIEKLVAAVVLVVCLVMLGRMLLSDRQQVRFDAWLQRLWQRLRHLRHVRPGAWLRPGARQDAARTAEEAIRRAQRAASARAGNRGGGQAGGQDGADAEGEWDGNVYRPKSFKQPRKPH